MSKLIPAFMLLVLLSSCSNYCDIVSEQTGQRWERDSEDGTWECCVRETWEKQGGATLFAERQCKAR